MVAVLDGPVATVPGEQLFGVSAVCGDGGDAIGDLLAGFAGLEVGALAGDAEGLARLIEDQKTLGQREDMDAAGVNAPVALFRLSGVMAGGAGCSSRRWPAS